MGHVKYLGIVLFLFVNVIVVTKRASGEWQTITLDSVGDTGREPSIAVGTSGAVYISYYNNSGTGHKYATNVSGAWATGAVSGGLGNSLAVGTSGASYISFFNWTPPSIRYTTNVSGTWETDTLENMDSSSWSYVDSTSIAVGTSGAAYIAYLDLSNKALKYATNVSGAWGTRTLDSSSTGDIVGAYPSLAVGTSGAVYISYYDDNTKELKYATNVSGAWGTSTIDSDGSVGNYGTSLAVGTSGAVYISYYNYSTNDLKYATNVSGSWVTSTIDSADSVGRYSSIAVSTSGAVHISYYDETNGSLKYATNASGAWGTSTVDNEGLGGRYSSIAVGMSGTVHIGYWDGEVVDLKYAVKPTYTAVTGAASGVTTSGGTLNGTANASGLNTTAYFQYGTTSGLYTGTSSTQSVSGTSDTAVSIALSELDASITYYYRLANQHLTDAVYGSEVSFTTSSSDGGGGEPPPKVTLTVSSTNPSNSETDVLVDTTISVTFSMLINGSTVDTDSICVTDPDGNTIEGTARTDYYGAVFTPASNLSYGATYTAVATTKIQAANWAGTQMDDDYSWSFTTELQPATPAPATTASPTPTPATTPTPVVVITTTAIPTPTLIPSPTGVTTPTPVSTATVTASPTPAATSTVSPAQTPSPTPNPTPTPVSEGVLSLSKEIAYLAGDTVIVTVADGDRNTSTQAEEILATAIKVAGDNYYIGNDLLLDLNEDGIDSGTFLATIKTGTATGGGAGSSVRSNTGTVYAIQYGTVTVAYSPDSSVSVTKKLSFSSFDATLAFDRPVYLAGEYAEITLSDAESNADHKEAETLLGQVYVQTSQFNTVGVWMAETGTDTGVFMGSIQISADSTLGYERIQASEENTLTASYYDETTTTGFPQLVTDTCSVATMSAPTVTPTPAMPVPSPEIMPSPNVTPSIPVPAPTPSTGACDEAEKITVSPDSLELEKGEEWQVTIKVTGVEGCMVEGVRVNRKISTSNKKKIMVQPSNQKTDAEGKAVFTITAKKVKCTMKDNCNAKVQFKAKGVKKKAEVVVWLIE